MGAMRQKIGHRERLGSEGREKEKPQRKERERKKG